MDERLAKLLCLVTEDVITTGEPVGSQHIVDTYALPVSSATIRNWFTELEEQGYVMQPHTSSGRVPTEKGYRTYVDALMKPKALSKRERSDLEQAIRASTENRESAIKTAAKSIADTVNVAVIVGHREADTYYTGLSQLFSQPEFRDWNRVISLSEILDKLDDVLLQIRRTPFIEPTAQIGSECPFGSACGSLLVSLSDGTCVGILGPMRMNYQLGFSLLRELKTLT